MSSSLLRHLMQSSSTKSSAPVPGPHPSQVVHDVGEVPLVLHSDVRGPLSRLSFLRRALALAELSLIAYNDPAEAQRASAAIGFPDAQLIDNDGSQAYRFRNDHDVVLAYRGTQLTEWNDIQADANAVLALLGSIGSVHSGFNREVDDLWPILEDLLHDNTQPLWFCGHSLGGAMATICAFRCKTSSIASNPQELHTFGSPRVGCKRYVRHAEVTHYRWVHNNDIVTRVPTIWMGYRHAGNEIYLDRFGRIRKLTGVWRSRDRWRGLLAGLLRWQLDLLSDHSIKLYAQHIAAAVNEELAALARGASEATSDKFVVRRQSKEQPCADASP